MSFLPVLLIAGATTLKTMSAIQEGQTIASAQEYNAAVAEAQAKTLQATGAFESQALEQQSKFEQQKITKEKQKMLSTQKAKYAKAGVSIEGSPLEVMSDTAAQYELDLAANKYNLKIGQERIRYERDVGVAISKSEAAYRKLLAKQAKTASYLKAGSTLLTGGYGAGQAGEWWS